MFVTPESQRIAILEAALACDPASLRVKAKDGETVDWLARAGLLIDAGDGTVTPTSAAIHFDELANL